MLLENKTNLIKKYSSNALKIFLDQKLQNIQEKPMDILKRLETHQQKSSSGESQLAGGNMFCNTVLVKVFQQNIIDPDEDEKELQADDDDGDDIDDHVSRRSKTSRKSSQSKTKSEKSMTS